MQFHWRLADAIFAVMWIGNIDEMYIISYCLKLSNETYYGDTAFQGNNIKIIVFQNIKFKTFVNDDSYYLCVFVLYVFWKCNSYVGIVITSKISSSKLRYTENFELLPLLNHSTYNEKHTTYQRTRLGTIYDSLYIFLNNV